VIPLKDNVPTDRFPAVTIVLVTLSLLAFAWQVILPSHEASSAELAGAHISKKNQAALEYGAIPFRLTHPGGRCGALPEGIFCTESASGAGAEPGGFPIPRDLDEAAWWITPFSSALLGTDLLHLVVNLLFLWIFGRTLEAALGRGRFALLLAGSAVVSVYAVALVDPDATGLTIGPAGMLAGVLGAYAAAYPRAKVLSLTLIPLFSTLVEVPAMLLVAAWFAIGLIPGLEQVVTPELLGDLGIAYVGYAASFLLGFGAIRVLARGRPEHRARPVPA